MKVELNIGSCKDNELTGTPTARLIQQQPKAIDFYSKKIGSIVAKNCRVHELFLPHSNTSPSDIHFQNTNHAHPR